MYLVSEEFRVLLAEVFDDYTEIECPEDITINSVSILNMRRTIEDDSEWN